MPGGMVRVVQPNNPANRVLIAVRGTILEHGDKQIGWWIFGKIVPVVRVAINQRHLDAFNARAREKMMTDGTRLDGIPMMIEIGMRKECLKGFPVGSEIGITFGYAGPLLQFYCGQEPLMIVDQQVLQPGMPLAHEIPVEC